MTPKSNETLERIARRIPIPETAYERMLRRRDRKQRNRRIGAAVLGIALALVTVAGLIRTFRTVERPADEPTLSPAGIFANVGGWIAYANDRVHQPHLGIWGVDPTRLNDREARIQLSDRPGKPVAWSSDGSKLLLISRIRDQEENAGPPRQGLFVLNSDGTVTRVVTNALTVGGEHLGFITGGSFSPDGSQVVFATSRGIYTVDGDGGTPRLVLAPTHEYRDGPLSAHERTSGSDLFDPAFSPDGTQIAYVDSHDWGATLRVMNPDGTGVRVLVGDRAVRPHGCFTFGRPGGVAWSPDGTRIAFGCSGGIWVTGADGSGLTEVIPIAEAGPWYGSPAWSPDGSRIAFEVQLGRWGRLAIADADGTNVTFGRGAHAGPWNPLLSAVPGEPNPTGTMADVSPFVYAVAALGVVGVLFLAWRARRRIMAR
jgi:Tol biopolymer transport system component